MKRKSPRSYTIYSHLKQANQFDFAKGDTVAFHKNLDKLLENIENKSFRDVIHHQRAVFYDKKGNYNYLTPELYAGLFFTGPGKYSLDALFSKK
jgi:hypothetical protein